ncbi:MULTISPECIES: NAD(P)-dependent oxidoreductase [unclassified Azospirillum]|uniref:NAD-dependent epimerase/dehydratase family protein n=1 Tax=unclassified Azospirillum TaxID=2630922 RepID=UPI000B647C51|nr:MULTISPECIES: NAD(P)-dependent oxidoreductase [unclassified Azospirillum]SNR86292.1 Nucleoside-diphosphate-sugar epimerase [Azospirillum sp. RU38E]SNS02388.1 Nucleoside-diphosphate-sugar epimerase [Azospirillum sp. RU37A]
MRVLVTGSSGRIGRAIWCALGRAGYSPVGLDRAPASTTAFVGDVGDPTLVARALTGVRAVIHTAALHAPHVGLVTDDHFRRINVDATVALADAARQRGIAPFIFTSTTALYGSAVPSKGPALWIDENTVPQPRSIYHHSKLQAEKALAAMAQDGGLTVTILRMSRCFPESAPIMAVYRLHRGIDARDVASAHVAALHRTGSDIARYIISGQPIFEPGDMASLGSDAAAVLTQAAPDLAAAFSQRCWRLPLRIDRLYDPAKAISELGWMPRYRWDEVLAELDRASSEVLPPGAEGNVTSE